MGRKSSRLVYYIGAHGPTVLLKVYDYDYLLNLRRLFKDLSHGIIEEVRLQDVMAIELDGLKGITLKVATSESRKTLAILKDSDGTSYFEWIRSQDGWHECACLVDGIIESNEPGHQYLTQEGTDNALIELSYKE